MCFTVYISTNTIQKVNTFTSGETYLFLEELTNEKEVIGLKKKFTKNYIYYVGSYQGCGCGFSYDPLEEIVEDEEDEKTKKSVEALITLVSKLTQNDNLEFYCCWDGDWEDEITNNKELNINNISLGNYFGLNEREFINFKNQSAA